MLRSKLYTAFACLLAAAATAVSAFAQIDGARINREADLKEAGEVWSQVVCLNDLVSDGWIQGRCAVDKATCCRWSMEGSRSRAFKREDLQRELSKLSFGGLSVSLRGAEIAHVVQAGRELSLAEVRAKIIQAVASKLGDELANISLSALKLSGPVYVSFNDENSWDISLPEQLSERAALEIVSAVDHTKIFGWAHVTLRQDVEVFVAKKTIRPTESLKFEDFEVRKANLLAAASAGQGLFRKDQFPDGVRAKLTLLAGAPLALSAIEKVPTVHSGDIVTLILRSDSLRVSAKGVAQGSAAVGDMVTVQLSKYNKTFRGRVIEGRFVEVWL